MKNGSFEGKSLQFDDPVVKNVFDGKRVWLARTILKMIFLEDPRES